MLLAWLAAATGAAPVELPPGEDVAQWEHALALAGIPALAGSARIVDQGDRWRVSVTDGRGELHALVVDAPRDRAGREALAAVVAGLLEPIATPEVALPPLPDIPPRPRPRPAPAIAPPPEVATAPDPVEAIDPDAHEDRDAIAIAPAPRVTPGGGAWSAPPDLDPPEAERPSPTRWGGAGAGLRLRPGVRSAPAVSGWLGATLPLWPSAARPVRATLGVGIAGAAPAALVGSDAVYRLAIVDVRGLAAWSPGPWELGPTAGVSWRAVLSGPEPAWVPTVGGALARRIPIGPRPGGLRIPIGSRPAGSRPAGSLRVGVLVEGDARRTYADWATADGVERDLLTPVSVELTLAAWTR